MTARQTSFDSIGSDDAASRIGHATFAAILEARQGDAAFRLTESALIAFLRPAIAKELPAVKRVAGRNVLFDAMAEGCGLTPPFTVSRAGQIAKAVKQILEVEANVGPEDIKRTAVAVCKKYEGAGPMAVASHWDEFASSRRQRKPKFDQYNPPQGWHDRAKAACEKLRLDDERTAEILALKLHEMPLTIQDLVLKP